MKLSTITLPKCIALAGIIVVTAVSARADSITSGNSIPLSQPQNIQSEMTANRPPASVADSVEFNSSLRKVRRETSRLVMRSEGAHTPEMSHDQREQTSAILPEPDTSILLCIGLLILVVMQRSIVRSSRFAQVKITRGTHL